MISVRNALYYLEKENNTISRKVRSKNINTTIYKLRTKLNAICIEDTTCVIKSSIDINESVNYTIDSNNTSYSSAGSSLTYSN